jgi:hypothetical protein
MAPGARQGRERVIGFVLLLEFSRQPAMERSFHEMMNMGAVGIVQGLKPNRSVAHDRHE